jgi:hypothetical protein
MRMRWLIGAVVALLVLVGAAIVPIGLGGASSQASADDDSRLVPVELVDKLLQKCQGDITLPENEVVYPDWVDADGSSPDRLWLVLYRFDPVSGEIRTAEPTAEQGEAIAAANECLAAYGLREWSDPPVFDAYHQDLYYRYLSGVLVPCLNARDLDAVVPVRAALQQFDPGVWFRNRVDDLDFDTAFDAWRACPPVPEYLVDAGRATDPIVTGFRNG